MVQPVTRIFDDEDAVRQAIEALQAEGFRRDQISFVGPGQNEPTEEASGVATGAAVGGAAGAGAGLLLALGVIAIPGLGPLVASGVLATTLAGAATGGIAGGLLGALADYGIAEEEAHVYAEAVRRGSLLLSVQPSDEAGAARAAAVMDRYEPVDVKDREQRLRDGGWQAYDPKARIYSKDEIEAERKAYRPK